MTPRWSSTPSTPATCPPSPHFPQAGQPAGRDHDVPRERRGGPAPGTARRLSTKATTQAQNRAQAPRVPKPCKQGAEPRAGGASTRRPPAYPRGEARFPGAEGTAGLATLCRERRQGVAGTAHPADGGTTTVHTVSPHLPRSRKQSEVEDQRTLSEPRGGRLELHR